ncbi:DsbA family protein [Bacillus sp. S/N-304-OC-R1]|uniref:DsbA family protein n=1 Tax=Bacillus sp. S/N-304-OC-R1 TaxID=2758034 RepID=UPI001C8D1D2B|nr:DsbA family protein [Bacillus sp. S/N-304-OC-R1]MBY0122266.1 DsbA family protein [Bacillus sp. S/N-304-OC-R1]
MSKNNMICDLTTGICGEVDGEEMEMIDLTIPQKKVTLYYVTDPICSHCWALEPVLRRYEQQYGQYLQIHTVMGGLLENWDGFADVSNGISSPADVAGHWREVGEHSRMPIDGSLWLTNPVQSSYVPSRVFKVIQQQDENLAKTFLRRAREAVFVFNQTISDEIVLIDLVNGLGLDGEAIVKVAGSSTGQQLLEQDFALSRSLGVRGFPTIIIVNEENKGVKIVGARPIESYVKGLEQALNNETPLPKPVPSFAELLSQEGMLFSKEIEIMYDLEQHEVNNFAEKQLSSLQYEAKEILGELYFEKK